jgi:hypothetical protein
MHHYGPENVETFIKGSRIVLDPIQSEKDGGVYHDLGNGRRTPGRFAS